jgi:hypothetical protein
VKQPGGSGGNEQQKIKIQSSQGLDRVATQDLASTVRLL